MQEVSYRYLDDQVKTVQTEIKRICEKLGKPYEEVTLIGVTKTYEYDVINASIDFGITDIGENRVQEIIRKYDSILSKVKWHLIGHLQTNKVKYIVDKVDLIHSVDSLKLAEEINRQAIKINKIQEILIQVNVADETQKFGISPESLPNLLNDIAKLTHIRVCGLMNIAPFVSDEDALRQNFKVMRKLYETLPTYNHQNVYARYLSMGMSNDYALALEEGANMLRIGTKIYGKRLK